jgi:hypothetical protein
MVVRFDEKAFLDDALVFFERTFDPICAIAFLIWHQGKDLIPAWSRVTKKHVRNARNNFTSAELMHSPTPSSAI